MFDFYTQVNPGRTEGRIPTSFGFITSIHLVKSPERVFVKARQNLKVIGGTFYMTHSGGPVRFVSDRLGSSRLPDDVRGDT